MKNKKKSLLLLLLILGISIGYAALTTTLNINGNTTIEKASWDIHFENLVKTTGSEVATTEAAIDETKTLIEYTVTLPKPGDYYEFTVDIVNNGTIDAMISEVLKEGLTTEQEKYIEYSAEYSGGVELQEKDILKAGEKDNIRVRVKYRDDITATDLPTDDTTLNLKFQVTYIQADESAVERTKFVCRRATELHTEECMRPDSEYHCGGAGYTINGSKGTTTITYGNLGTRGILTSGDAFDCDVNGDGTYDSETERFYYVSELYNTNSKQFNNNFAVLIYYNNTYKGEPNNTLSEIQYYDASKEGNWYGPVLARTNLPTTKQWGNVRLSNTKRAILSDTGANSLYENRLPVDFSYEGYASRLLTTQELEFACNKPLISNVVGNLDSCNYLVENTDYSTTSINSGAIWLENPVEGPYENSNDVWFITARIVNYSDARSKWSVRPVIEVPKSNILY